MYNVVFQSFENQQFWIVTKSVKSYERPNSELFWTVRLFLKEVVSKFKLSLQNIHGPEIFFFTMVVCKGGQGAHFICNFYEKLLNLSVKTDGNGIVIFFPSKKSLKTYDFCFSET